MTWQVRSKTRAATVVAVLLAATVAMPADAAPPMGTASETPQPRRRATIDLRVRDEPRFRDVLLAALATAEVAFDVEIASGPAPYRVTVIEEDTSYEIHVDDDERDRIYTRRIERTRDGLDEVAIEATAHVVVYALEALGRGETIGTPRGKPEAPASRTAPTARSATIRPGSAPSPRFSFGTRASVTGYASNAPAVFGVGALAAVRLARPSFEVAAVFEQHAPTEIRSSTLASRFHIMSGKVLARGDLALTPRVHVGPSLGLGLERIGVTTRSRSGGSEPALSSSDVLGVVVLGFGARAMIVSQLWIQADVGLELPLERVEYVVERSTGPLTFLDPWPVRPWTSLALVAEL